MSRPCTHVHRGACPSVGCGRTVRAFLVCLYDFSIRTASMSRPCTHVHHGCGRFSGARPSVGCGRTVRAFLVYLYDFSIRTASMPRPCTHVNCGRGRVCGARPGVGCGRTVRAFLVNPNNSGTSTTLESSCRAIHNFIWAVRAFLVYFDDLGISTASISRPCTHVNRGCGCCGGAWPSVGCGRTVRAFVIDLCNVCARTATVSATPTDNHLCGRRSRGVPFCASLSRRLGDWTVCSCLVPLCNGGPRTAFEFVGIARFDWW